MIQLVIFFVLCFQNSHWNVNEYGVALSGYDPVSYFQGNHRPGKPELACQHEEVIFYFTSIENLEIFQANPEAYIPLYGGYCAYAMGATGDKVEVNPDTYKIVNGKLFLFYNKGGNKILQTWNKRERNLIKRADKNWQKITSSNN